MISTRAYNARIKAWTMAWAALLACGSASAQPYCDVLLRPAFGVSFSGNAVSCANLSTPLTTGTTELWSYGDATAPNNYAYHEYDSMGIYTICLTLSTQDGTCSSTYCRDVIVPENTCGGAWNADFTSAQTSTNTLSFMDISTSGTPDTRQWGFGDFTTSTAESPTHTWLLPGSHFVHLTRTLNDCAVTESHWVSVDGNASTCGQDLFVNFSYNDLGDQILFQPELSTTVALPALALWSYGDGQADTAFVTSHSYAEPGNYQVCLFIGASNTSTLDTCFAFVCQTITFGTPLVGISEVAEMELTVWPVPFQNEIHLSASWLIGTCTARLKDVAGREVHGTQQTVTERMDLHLPDLPRGVYVLETTSILGSKRTLLVRD